jgi:hypothetical protein
MKLLILWLLLQLPIAIMIGKSMKHLLDDGKH